MIMLLWSIEPKSIAIESKNLVAIMIVSNSGINRVFVSHKYGFIL